MTRIHNTACIATNCQLAEDVTVGPYTVIEADVSIGAGTVIGPHCHFLGRCQIGQNNRFHAGCVIGDAPQHMGYNNEPTNVTIGNNNVFREHVTVHRGMPSTNGRGVTTIGDHNFLMANSHIAHDCLVGSHCILANGALVGGHAEVMDRAYLSGNTAVHQFCRVGQLSMISGTTAISQDLPPFWIAQGRINEIRGVNVIGMRRAGYSREDIQAVRKFYRMINLTGVLIPDAMAELESEHNQLRSLKELFSFIRTSKRGIVAGNNGSEE